MCWLVSSNLRLVKGHSLKPGAWRHGANAVCSLRASHNRRFPELYCSWILNSCAALYVSFCLQPCMAWVWYSTVHALSCKCCLKCTVKLKNCKHCCLNNVHARTQHKGLHVKNKNTQTWLVNINPQITSILPHLYKIHITAQSNYTIITTTFCPWLTPYGNSPWRWENIKAYNKPLQTNGWHSQSTIYIKFAFFRKSLVSL